MLSIELINKDAESIVEVLDSIKVQTYTDFEVIAVDSSQSNVVDYSTYGDNFRHVRQKVSMLSARFRAHQDSTGEYCLLLDGTRVLTPDCLDVCVKAIENQDMLVIPENSIGNSPVARLFRLDREATKSEYNRARGIDPLRGYVLPRFFRRKVLDKVFASLVHNIPPEIFESIIGGDHQLIFYEALKFSSKIGYAQKDLISHVEDKDLLSMFRKYYRYGSSRKIFKQLPAYQQLSSFRNATRTTNDLDPRTALAVWTLTALKGIPFVLGYYL